VRAAFAASLLAAAAQAAACELPDGGRTVESPRYALAYRTQPARIAVGEHFVVEIAVCAKGNAASPGAVEVDAWMPEHRHGMNYKAGVSALGGGRFRAEGLMFHMPGRWELLFDLGGERLADSVRLE
jgi:hypothetical protein